MDIDFDEIMEKYRDVFGFVNGSYKSDWSGYRYPDWGNLSPKQQKASIEGAIKYLKAVKPIFEYSEYSGYEYNFVMAQLNQFMFFNSRGEFLKPRDDMVWLILGAVEEYTGEKLSFSVDDEEFIDEKCRQLHRKGGRKKRISV